MIYEVSRELVFNISILLMISILYMFIPNIKNEKNVLKKIITGVFVGIIGVAVMLNPVKFSPGIQFDSRSIIICISGLFFGIIPTAIGTLIISIFRIYQGGIGAFPGVVIVISSATIGLLWHKFFYKKLTSKKGRFLNLYLFGLIVHIVYISCFFLLPWSRAVDVFRNIAIPTIALYPIGTVFLALILFSQIDNRKVKMDLEVSKNELKTYMMGAPYGVIVANEKGQIIEANNELLKMSGYTKDEILKLDISNITSKVNDEEGLNSFKNLVKDGYIDINKKYIIKNNETRIWNLRAVKLSNTRYIGFFNDITDLKELEKANIILESHMRNQQKLEAIGTLAAGVAHEINNPINGIMNYGQIILDLTKKSDETYEYAKEIIHETNRVSKIVKNLLQFSRNEGNQISVIKIEDIIGQTLSLINTIIANDQIILEVDLEADTQLVMCNSQQIQQIIMNLMTNARDALNQKYKGYNENKKMIITSQMIRKQDKDVARITIEDHGNGIPLEIQDSVFDPFFTTKGRTEGTGLGLAISYNIAKEHGGKLFFETEEGEYTKFHLELDI